jgi:3D-(3,5/4)-trihydroxycyclohexane-1,2-dione acylhydrolase (decyclizing)
MRDVHLTASQALIRYLCSQYIEIDGKQTRFFAGMWAIFGHGNVAGIGEALYAAREVLPTYRAHNEQAMAHGAIAFAKASRRRRAMACTTSIGPGALNMVTAAGVAHVNRLPVLFLPGDVFASRRPDPVLQQIEYFGDGTISANDCFKPVSRYFDRIARPEQLIDALPRAMATLTDPAACGPVTLALCQDTQTEAFHYPQNLFETKLWRIREQPADPYEIASLIEAIRRSKSPIIIAGGGVLYANAESILADFANATGIPVSETQAGKGALPWDHPAAVGAVGVTGTSAANELVSQADLIVGIGTRLQDFTTGSRALFNPDAVIAQINVTPYDGVKHGAMPVVGDAKQVLLHLKTVMADYRVPAAWTETVKTAIAAWNLSWQRATSPSSALPSDAQVVGAINRKSDEDTIVVGAAGGLPGELHKLWRSARAGGYHLEYGFSCMGYEIAGGLGVKLARPESDVVVMVGDGSYLMLNSEIATSVMLDRKLIIVVLDNGGFGCIHRLQSSTVGIEFNNMLANADGRPAVDFVQHATSLGAIAERAENIHHLEEAFERAKSATRTFVIVIRTDPDKSTADGGAWWDVAVPEVSDLDTARVARERYERIVARREDLP